MGERKPLVVSVILAFGSENQLNDCLTSLVSQTGVQQQIVLVQNGAADELIDRLEQQYAGIILIRNGSNVGAAGGRNVGIRWAIENDAEYLFFADNDATFALDALSNLIEVVSNNTQLGFASCVVWRKSDPNQIFSAGGLIEPPLSTRHLYSFPENCPILEVDFVPSCAVLVPVNTIHRIGLMDESLFVYDEDLDWCLKGKTRGLKTVVITAAAAYHDITPDKIKSPLRTYYGIRNRLVVFRQHKILSSHNGGNWRAIQKLISSLWYRNLWGKGELSITCAFAYTLGIMHSQLGRLGAAPKYLQRPNANFLESRFRLWLQQTLLWKIAKIAKQAVFRGDQNARLLR